MLSVSRSCSNFTRSLSSLRDTKSHEKLLDIFDSLLRQCTTKRQRKQVHAQILVTDLRRSAFLASLLVSVYSQSGLVTDARKVFDEFPVESCSNVLLWNSLIRVNVSHGFHREALKLFDRMLKLKVWPDGFTFPLVIRACSFVDNLALCKRLHSRVLQMGFRDHIYVGNELLGMYGKLGLMSDATQVFDAMCIRSCVSWNTMISGYAFNSDCDGASKMFMRMKSDGFEPNSVTWTSLLSSHARCGRYEECFRLFGSMRSTGVKLTAELLAVVLSVCADVAVVDKGKAIHACVVKGGFECYLFTKNAIICMYGKCKDFESAQKSFSEMGTKSLVSWNALISSYAESGLCDEAYEVFTEFKKMAGCSSLRANIITWTAVIGGFASKGRGEESLELFRRMQEARVDTNSVNLCSVLSVCADLAALNLGREIHGHVIRAAMDNNVLVVNALINMYTKCGMFKQGHSIFETLAGKDLVSWNTMITGYGMHGLGKNALEMFDKMIRSGFNPDHVTFVAILSACSHAGLVVEGRSIFNEMNVVYKVKPEMEHYACVVDLLARSGMIQEASDIVKSMPMEPNAWVWSALLSSCRNHKDVEVTDTPLGSMGSYMLLSNVHASSGRFEESARVRISARAKGMRKIPGQSWIEVKKKIYTFSAGNVAQTDSESVHKLLHELALRTVVDHEEMDDRIEN